MFGLSPRTHWERHNGPDGTITPSVHPGVFRPLLYYVALHRPCSGATISSLREIRAHTKHLNRMKVVMNQTLKRRLGVLLHYLRSARGIFFRLCSCASQYSWP